jgi:putative ABC transport system ATP-binding protein
VVFADELTGNLDSKTTVEIMEMICSFAGTTTRPSSW